MRVSGTLAVAFLAALCLPCCSTPDVPVMPWDHIEGKGSQRRVLGDWDDINAALLIGEEAAEVSRLSVSYPTPNRIVYPLRSITDEPGQVTFTRNPAETPDAKGSITITVTAEIGRGVNRNSEREEILVDAIAKRLRRLAGVEVAPVPGSSFSK